MLVYVVFLSFDGEPHETFVGLAGTRDVALKLMEKAWRENFGSDMPPSTESGNTELFRSRHYNGVRAMLERVHT